MSTKPALALYGGTGTQGKAKLTKAQERQHQKMQSLMQFQQLQQSQQDHQHQEMMRSAAADADPDNYIITSHGIVYFKGPGGELNRIHGNSKLHPKNQMTKLDGSAPQGRSTGAVLGAALPAASAAAAAAAAVGSKKAQAEAMLQAKQNALNIAVAEGAMSIAPGADYTNSFDNCTLYSSGYLNPQAGQNTKSAFDHRQVARCPICDQPVAGGRFAPHLERCLSGGKRAGIDLASLAEHAGGTSKVPSSIGTLSSAKYVKYLHDPHPHSPIVRIRINVTGAAQGQPKVYQDREGVSLEEWERTTAAAARR